VFFFFIIFFFKNFAVGVFFFFLMLLPMSKPFRHLVIWKGHRWPCKLFSVVIYTRILSIKIRSYKIFHKPTIYYFKVLAILYFPKFIILRLIFFLLFNFVWENYDVSFFYRTFCIAFVFWISILKLRLYSQIITHTSLISFLEVPTFHFH